MTWFGPRHRRRCSKLHPLEGLRRAANIHISVDLQIHSNAMVMGDDSELSSDQYGVQCHRCYAGAARLATKSRRHRFDYHFRYRRWHVSSVIICLIRFYDQDTGQAGFGCKFGIIRRHG